MSDEGGWLRLAFIVLVWRVEVSIKLTVALVAG